MSAWFGTMGYGLPATIAGQLSYPDSQVFNIAGDGGFAMVMQDLLTQVQYDLPIINVVLENKVFGFIQHEKIQAAQEPYGINFIGADWAGFADSMGAIGIKVSDRKSLAEAFAKINELQKSGNTKPILIDAKIKTWIQRILVLCQLIQVNLTKILLITTIEFLTYLTNLPFKTYLMNKY